MFKKLFVTLLAVVMIVSVVNVSVFAKTDDCSLYGYCYPDNEDPKNTSDNKEITNEDKVELNSRIYQKRNWAESGIKVAVNGNQISFPDQEPLLDADIGRTYVPIRFLAEALGAEVDWDDNHKVVIIKNYGIEGKDTGATHYLRLGENKFVTVQWKTYKPDGWYYATVFYYPDDIYPIIVNDRTMLPFRYVAELLGSQVYYDPLTGTAHCVKRDFSNVKTGGDTPGLNANGTKFYTAYPIVSTVIGEYFTDELNKLRRERLGFLVGDPDFRIKSLEDLDLTYDGVLSDANTWGAIDHVLHPEWLRYDQNPHGFMHAYSSWLPPEGFTAVRDYENRRQKNTDVSYMVGALEPFYLAQYGYVPEYVYKGGMFRENGVCPEKSIFFKGRREDQNSDEAKLLKKNWGIDFNGRTTYLNILDEEAYREISRDLISTWAGSSKHDAVLVALGTKYVGVSLFGQYAYMSTTQHKIQP